MSGPTRVTPPGTQEATKAPPVGQRGAPADPPPPRQTAGPALRSGSLARKWGGGLSLPAAQNGGVKGGGDGGDGTTGDRRKRGGDEGLRAPRPPVGLQPRAP